MITDFIKTITSKERYKKIARHLAKAGYQVKFDGKKVVGRSDIKKL